MSIPIENKRLREVREDLGFTQADFAQMIGAGSSTVDIERGKVKLSGVVVKELFQQFQINPAWLFGESEVKKIRLNAASTLPKVISIDQEGNENIVMVSQKAAAGYGQNVEDDKWMGALPMFQIPLPEYRNRSYRGFEVKGDSMSPMIEDKSWVICSAVEKLEEVKNGEIYVVVEEESIRLKMIQKDTSQHLLNLISLNPAYEPVIVPYEKVVELWKFHSQLNFGQINDRLTLNQIYAEIQEIKKKIS